MAARLNHIIAFVADMDGAVRFYRDVVGLPLKFQSPVCGVSLLLVKPLREESTTT